MKNLVLIIAAILLSNLPAMAESAQTPNEQKIIEKQEGHLEAKEKIDISVTKQDCADNISNNWLDPSPD